MNTVKQFLHNNDTWQCPVNIKKIKLKVFGKLRNQISASHQSNFALLSSGMGVAWGANGNGKFGDNSITNTSSPTTMAGGAKFYAIAAKYNSSCGITFDGVAYCWGANANGQLGDNSVTMKSTPTLVVGNLRFRSIGAVGTATFIGLTNNGEIYSWGINGSGQLGDNSVTPRSSPVLVLGGKTNWVDIDTSSQHCMALDSSGNCYCWGRGTNGQLGNSTTTDVSSPVIVSSSQGFKVIDEIFLTEKTLDVIPNETYTVSLLNKTIFFGEYLVYDNNFTPIYLEISYGS